MVSGDGGRDFEPKMVLAQRRLQGLLSQLSISFFAISAIFLRRVGVFENYVHVRDRTRFKNLEIYVTSGSCANKCESVFTFFRRESKNLIFQANEEFRKCE